MDFKVCFVCLKRFSSGNTSIQIEEDVENLSLFIKLLKFAQNYLGICSVGTIIEQLVGVDNEESSKRGRRTAFCEKCEVAVISPLCQIYLQLLSLQLRLSWELDHLGELLQSSKSGVDDDKGLRMLFWSLSDQLGIVGVGKLEEFRNLLASKCKRKGSSALPKVHLERLKDLPLKTEPVLAEDNDSHSYASDGYFKAGDVGDDPDVNEEDLEKDDPTFEPDEHQVESPQIRTPPEKRSKGRIRRAKAMKQRDGKKWKCGECEKVFLNESRLQTHQLCHHQPLNCHLCEATCKGTHSLEAHVKLEHPQEQVRLACPSCSKIYPSTVRLAQHICRYHYYETRYNCSHCDFSVHTRYAFDKHLNSAHPGATEESGESFQSKNRLGGQKSRAHRKVKAKTRVKNTRNRKTVPEWQCELCGLRTTNKQRHLQVHEKKSTEEKGLQCCFCYRKFSLQLCLDSHVKIYHSKRLSKHRGFNCEVEGCEEEFQSIPSLNEHLRTHSESLELCQQCGLGFIGESRLKLHTLLHLEPLVKSSPPSKLKRTYRVCPECRKTFHSADDLQSHYNLEHGIHVGNWDCMKCGECEEKFGSKKQLIYHQRMSHLPKKCSVCEEKLTGVKAYNEHINVFHSEAFSCPIPTCDKRFKAEDSFQHHLRSHKPKPGKIRQEMKSDEKRICEHCGKTMSNKKRLQKHIKLVHSKEPHICPHCGKIYSAKIYLSNHIIRYHSDQCAQGFKLDFHCPHCPERFRWKSVLNRHLYTTHRDKGLVDGLIECNVCGLRMEKERAGLMKRHMEKHIPIEERRSLMHICKVCKKEFLAIENYNNHIVTHVENQTEDTLKCHVCDKPFYYKHRLKTHLRTHQEAEVKEDEQLVQDNSEGGTAIL